MSSLHTMIHGFLGNSSEIFVGAAFLFTIIVGCVVTYIFGFGANSNQESSSSSSNASNEEKKLKEKKSTKKPSTTTTTTTAAAMANVKKDEPVVVSVSKKATKPAPPTAAETKSKKNSPAKSTNKETVMPKAAPQVPAKAAPLQQQVEAAEALSSDDGWITVVDKKQKKSPSITELNATAQAAIVKAAASATAVVASPKNGKQKEKNNANKQASAVKVDEPNYAQPESDVVLDDVVKDDQEDDWIPANSKVSKKVSRILFEFK